MIAWLHEPVGWRAQVAYIAGEEAVMVVAWVCADGLLPAPEGAGMRTHCWIHEGTGPEIVAWSRAGGRWRAQVAHVVDDGQAPALITAWIEAGGVRRAGTPQEDP